MARQYPNRAEAESQGYFPKVALHSRRLKPNRQTPFLRYWQGMNFVTAYLASACVQMRPYRAPTAAQLAALAGGRALARTRKCRACGNRVDLDWMEKGVCFDCLQLQEATREQEREKEIYAAAASILAASPRTVDTEATGLDDDDQVIEIAILDAGGEVLFESLVQPTVPLKPAAAAVNGITEDELASAPTWPEIYPVVASLLYGRPVVAHSAEFDRRLLAQTCVAHGLSVLDADWNCTMDLMRFFNGGHRISLANSMAIMGVARPEQGRAHRAVHDAECCRRVLAALASRNCLVSQPEKVTSAGEL